MFYLQQGLAFPIGNYRKVQSMREKICGIYKISFLSTDKVYIGQSTDIYRRLSEHWLSASADETCLNQRTARDYQLPIHRAMRKYSLGKTCLEILERCEREQLDEREKYWIDYYHSDDKKYGYNLSHGGQDTFGLSGERHSRAVLTQDQVNQIICELQKDEKTAREIAENFDISPVTICNINKGKTWHNNTLSYPIRKDGNDSPAVQRSVAEKRREISSDTALEIRKKYATMCPLQEVYDTFPDLKPSFINRIIYRRDSYIEVPFFNRKTQEWELVDKTGRVSTIPYVEEAGK